MAVRIIYKEINIPAPISDVWHGAKSLMIIFFCIAVILFDKHISRWQDYFINLLIYGGVWNGTFGLFYNIIFRIK
jgi:hypothetical protein